jgi:putative secretion ATPase (PEP-CTERM system associated)
MYVDYYNFRGPPFQLTPDHRFFFESREHSKAAAYLQYGLAQGEGFIVITGEVGSGKTTLIDHMLEQLQGRNIVIGKVVTTQLHADDLLRLVAQAFGVEQEGSDKATILARFEAFLAENHRLGKHTLLFVDEAQNLSPGALEELRMFSNFQTDNKSLLQSILIGQPQFRQKLYSADLEQLKQRVIATHHLYPLDAEDSRKYIEHRLQTADWQNDPSFTDRAMEAIYRETGGIPRKINVLCNRLLIYCYLESLHRVDNEVVEYVIAELREESREPNAESVDPLPDDEWSEGPTDHTEANGSAWTLPGVRQDQRMFAPEDQGDYRKLRFPSRKRALVHVAILLALVSVAGAGWYGYARGLHVQRGFESFRVWADLGQKSLSMDSQDSEVPSQVANGAGADGNRSQPQDGGLGESAATPSAEPEQVQSAETSLAIPAASQPGEVAALGDGARGRVYGELDADARIVLRATEDCWLEVRDPSGAVIASRVLRAGDSYRVPNRAKLTLVAGNAGGLQVEADGKIAAPLGPRGAIRRNVALDPDSLLGGDTLAQ